jgi:hypothetical protein
LQLASQRLDALPTRNAQKDPRMLDLKPRSGATARERFKDGDIIGIER